eukprot:347597_1
MQDNANFAKQWLQRNKINMETEYLISAYIRNNEKLWKTDNIYYKIPDIVLYIVLLYYWTDDDLKYGADLYSIIIVVEHLERVWARGIITDQAYIDKCKKYIQRYKSISTKMEKYYPKISDFFDEYAPDCHAARNRLVTIGVPANHFIGCASGCCNIEPKQLIIAQTVQCFITTIDSLQLSMKEVKDFKIHLNDLMESINNVTALPIEHISKTIIKKWIIKLNEMKSLKELSDNNIKQLILDLENSYSHFVKFLQLNSQLL